MPEESEASVDWRRLFFQLKSLPSLSLHRVPVSLRRVSASGGGRPGVMDIGKLVSIPCKTLLCGPCAWGHSAGVQAPSKARNQMSRRGGFPPGDGGDTRVGVGL